MKTFSVVLLPDPAAADNPDRFCVLVQEETVDQAILGDHRRFRVTRREETPTLYIADIV